MKKSQHGEMIREWVEREKAHKPSTKWFRRSVVAAVLRSWEEDGGPYDEDDYADEREGAPHLDPPIRDAASEVGAWIHVVPDAYYIDYEERLIVAFEAAVTSGWSERKSRWYSNLWFDLDCECWSLVVVERDRWGNERQRDLMTEWYWRQLPSGMVGMVGIDPSVGNTPPARTRIGIDGEAPHQAHQPHSEAM